MKLLNKPFAASRSRGTKPPCWRAKAFLTRTRQTKKITIWNYVCLLFVFSQCDFCPPIRRFFITWMASCKGPIKLTWVREGQGISVWMRTRFQPNFPSISNWANWNNHEKFLKDAKSIFLRLFYWRLLILDPKVPQKGAFPGNDIFFLACNCIKGTGTWLNACSFIKMLFFCRDMLYCLCKQYDRVIMLSKNQSAYSPGSHLHLINLNICK